MKWDKIKVLEDLNTVAAQNKKIVWTSFAKEHEIEGNNKGQVIKEFAAQNGLDTTTLSKYKRKKTRRSSKKKFTGKEYSIPIPPSAHQVKARWNQMIEQGEIQLGVACSPYTIHKYVVKQGKVHAEDIQVEGRKIPLYDIRKKLLLKNEKFMHLYSDAKINAMDIDEVRRTIKVNKKDVDTEASLDELRMTLKQLQRTRTLAMWHDHATILGRGYIMLTVHTLYDPAVYLASIENSIPTVQTMVEEPELYMISLNSSTVEDQAALIADRVSCLYDLAEPTLTTNGVEITDKLRFFIGDHPAAQFERGTQMGGNFKCGGCGCKATIMDDLAHSLICRTQSLQNLQSLALKGVLGKIPGNVKPLYAPHLPVADIRRELRARGIPVCGKTRKVLQNELQEILKGVQRVPSLLLMKPDEDLHNLNLQHYTVLDCEPLHDIKGHLLNLFHELPSVLPTSIRAECQGRINICLQKPKKSAGDLRATLVQLFMMIHTHASQVNWKVHLLLQSITIVCKILYANDCERCPKLLLQLYNNTWIHHQLCFDLFQSTTVVSRGTFFGLYLHALCKHAPEQYELVCLKSVNTENQERMFGQSRLIAEHTTNRHPDNIITSILMHMQVKNEIYKTTNSSETVVSVAATCLPEFNGTFVPLDWVNRRQDSWQAHLKRISPFLACGKGEWWTQSDKGYLFHDGKSDSSYNLKGPDLLHFRDSSIEAVYRRQEECWECIIDDRIELPTKSVKLYTKNGEYTSTRHTAVEFIPSTSDEMPHPSTMHPSTSDQMPHPSTVHPSTSHQMSHPSTVHPSTSDQMSHPSSVHPSTSDQTSHPSTVHPSASDQMSHPSSVHPSTSDQTSHPSSVHPSASDQTSHPSTVHPSTSDQMPHPSTVHPSTSDQTSHPSSVHPSTSDQTSHPSSVHPSASDQTSHPSTVHPSTSNQIPHPSTVHPSTSDQMPHPSTVHPSTSDQMSHPSTVHPSTSDQMSHPSTVHPFTSGQNPNYQTTQNASNSHTTLTCTTKDDDIPLSCVFVTSKLCQAIAKCIGETEEVKQLDKLRITLKTDKTMHKKNTFKSIESYKYLLAKVRLHVMKARRDCEHLLSKHEQDFFIQYGRIPRDENDSPTWANLNKKTNYANKLLLAWNTDM